MEERQGGEKTGSKEGIDVLSLMQALLRRKMLIISITSLTAVISCCYSLTLPNIYAATAKVLPPQKEGAGISSILGQMGGIAGVAAGAAAKGNESELYLSLLKSRSVGTAVIQRLDLAKIYHTKSFNQTWRRLDAAVKVQAGREGIIAITAEDKDPKTAALLANTMADELGRTMVRLNLTKVGSEKLFLEKRLELVKKGLTAAEEDLKSFAQRNRIAHVESQATASVTSVAKVKGELATKEAQLAALRTSQSEESYEVKELQATIQKMKQEVGGLTGAGRGTGIPSLAAVPELGLEYARKLREVKTQEALFEQLTKQYELAKLNQAKDSSTLQVLDEAVPPEEKSRPRRSTMVGMATLIALVASVVLSFVLEFYEKLPEADREALADMKRGLLSFR